MTPVLALDGLSVDLARGGFLSQARLRVVHGVTLAVAAGETLALVGESGSGKTTLARAVMGLTPVAAGEVRFLGQRVAGPAGLRRLRAQGAMLFQDAVASLSPRLRVATLLAEPFRIHRRPLPDPAGTVRALLAAVGLPETVGRRFPHELSGGQARRIGLARALALSPRLLVADEPTAGLDVSVQAEVLNLLDELRRDRGLALLVITHNLALVRHVAHRVAVLYLGEVVEEAPAADLFAAPAHPYTAALLAAEPLPDPARRRRAPPLAGEPPSPLRRPRGCAFHPRCPQARDLCRTAPPPPAPAGPGRTALCHFPLTEPRGRTT